MTNMLNTTTKHVEKMEDIVSKSEESYETYYEVLLLLNRLMVMIEHMETRIIDQVLHNRRKQTNKSVDLIDASDCILMILIMEYLKKILELKYNIEIAKSFL